MEQFKRGEMEIIEKDGHRLYITDTMMKAFEVLEKNKDKIMKALEEQQKEREEKQAENIVSFRTPLQKYNALPDEYKGLVLGKAKHMITSHYKGFTEIYNALTEQEKADIDRTLETLTMSPEPSEADLKEILDSI